MKFRELYESKKDGLGKFTNIFRDKNEKDKWIVSSDGHPTFSTKAKTKEEAIEKFKEHLRKINGGYLPPIFNEAYDRDKDFEQQIKDIGDSLKVIENDAYRKDNYTFAYDIAFNALLLYSNMIENSNDAKAKAHKKYSSNILKDVIKEL